VVCCCTRPLLLQLPHGPTTRPLLTWQAVHEVDGGHLAVP
jgi:hypothetical protein